MTPATTDGHERESADQSGSATEVRALLPARLAAIGAALGCLIAAVYLGVHRSDAENVREASERGRAGDFAAAARVAQDISRFPAKGRALVIEAHALRGLGRARAAAGAFARAAERDPDNWTVRRDWAITLAELGDQEEAVRQLRRALELNPRIELPPGFKRRLRAP